MKCCETKKFVEMSLAQFLNSTNRIRARRASIHQFQFYSNFCQQQFEMVIVSTFPTTFVLFVYLCAFHSYCVCETNDRHSSDKILSRKRRHLIFPKGSSIQLGTCRFHSLLCGVFAVSFIWLCVISVYDSVLTVPDYTIYIVTGVTCALAWGLPDKPIYPENDLMDHYEDGELPGLQYRIDANVTENASSRNSTNANRLPATANSTTTTIDNRTLMNLFRLFNANVGRITNANANVPPANVFGTIPQYRNGTLRRKTNGQMFEHLTNRNRNYYYKQTPANVSHSYSFAGYSSRNRNGAFEKKHAGDYSYKPWINRRWNVKTPKMFVVNLIFISDSQLNLKKNPFFFCQNDDHREIYDHVAAIQTKNQ